MLYADLVSDFGQPPPNCARVELEIESAPDSLNLDTGTIEATRLMVEDLDRRRIFRVDHHVFVVRDRRAHAPNLRPHDDLAPGLSEGGRRYRATLPAWNR